jgi:hypothetical protein
MLKITKDRERKALKGAPPMKRYRVIYVVIQEDPGQSGGVPLKAFESEDRAEKEARRLNRIYDRLMCTVHNLKLFTEEDYALQ